MKELLNNIRELTEKEGPSGREGEVAKVIRKNWQNYGEIHEDSLGKYGPFLQKSWRKLG